MASQSVSVHHFDGATTSCVGCPICSMPLMQSFRWCCPLSSDIGALVSSTISRAPFWVLQLMHSQVFAPGTWCGYSQCAGKIRHTPPQCHNEKMHPHPLNYIGVGSRNLSQSLGARRALTVSAHASRCRGGTCHSYNVFCCWPGGISVVVVMTTFLSQDRSIFVREPAHSLLLSCHPRW